MRSLKTEVVQVSWKKIMLATLSLLFLPYTALLIILISYYRGLERWWKAVVKNEPELP